MRKKLIFVLAMVAIVLTASPASATVVVACRDLGGGVAEFSYDWSDEAVAVRAFALDIRVDSGATIESISDYKVGISTAADPGYGVFAGSIAIDDKGNVIDWGSPVVDPAFFPDALPGLGTYGITVELGALYLGPENAPLSSGTLFKIAISWNDATLVNVNIALDATRGGIIMEDRNIIPEVNLIGCTLVPEPATLLLFGLGAVILRKRR